MQRFLTGLKVKLTLIHFKEATRSEMKLSLILMMKLIGSSYTAYATIILISIKSEFVLNAANGNSADCTQFSTQHIWLIHKAMICV